MNKKITYHFLLYVLEDYVKDIYDIVFDEKSQNYLLLHKFQQHNNIFIIIRTSKRCYRVAHYVRHNSTTRFMYFSAVNYRQCARKINGVVYRYVLDDLRPP